MTAGAGSARPERLVAALAGLFAFVIYVRTLYPGLVPRGDSPKFQFVGRIWGTPHNPGYPLYVVVSHYFSLVPIGTLAYRINPRVRSHLGPSEFQTNGRDGLA